MSILELNVKNLSKTLLTQDIGLTETSFKVADAGALPNPPFLITVEGEIMRVGSKNVSTNTLSNVLRGREGTSPAPHSSGTVVENRFTAGTYDEIKQSFLAHKAEDASTTTKGHVQLNNTVTSTSTTQAATANAVKTAYDKGNHNHPYAPTSHTHDDRYYKESEIDTKLEAKVDKPASATSGNIAVFDGGAGKLKDSGVKTSSLITGIVLGDTVLYTSSYNDVTVPVNSDACPIFITHSGRYRVKCEFKRGSTSYNSGLRLFAIYPDNKREELASAVCESLTYISIQMDTPKALVTGSKIVFRALTDDGVIRNIRLCGAPGDDYAYAVDV